MMIELNQAKEEIEKLLKEEQSGLSEYNLVISKVLTYEFGWVFYYTSEEYLESKDVRHMLLGNAPFIYDKENGSIHETGTFRSIDYFVDRYRIAKKTNSEPDWFSNLE